MDMKLVNFTMPKSLEKKLSEAALMSQKKKSQFVRDCVIKELVRLGFDVTEEDVRSNQGSRNDLPNRVTEAEKRARKGLRPRGRPRKLRVELGGGGSSGLIPARIDADGELRPLVPASEPRERSRRKTA